MQRFWDRTRMIMKQDDNIEHDQCKRMLTPWNATEKRKNKNSIPKKKKTHTRAHARTRGERTQQHKKKAFESIPRSYKKKRKSSAAQAVFFYPRFIWSILLRNRTMSQKASKMIRAMPYSLIMRLYIIYYRYTYTV